MTFPASIPLSDHHRESASILVVEDDIALRFTLASWLRLLGYIVLEAACADEASVLLASPIPVDLIITDVEMPGRMQGEDFVQYLRKIFPALPLIVVSGGIRRADLGACVFFRKPYNLEDMALCIERLLPEAVSEVEHAQ